MQETQEIWIRSLGQDGSDLNSTLGPWSPVGLRGRSAWELSDE